MKSPTAQTIKILKKNGWHPAIVERWNQFAKVRQDLFGFIDLLAMKNNGVLLGIQATSTGNMSARTEKSLASPMLRVWLSTGNMFEVWGWSKMGAQSKQKLWTCQRQPIERLDMEELTITIPGTILRPSKMV